MKKGDFASQPPQHETPHSHAASRLLAAVQQRPDSYSKCNNTIHNTVRYVVEYENIPYW